MASRALTARLTKICSTWPGSALVATRSRARAVRNDTSSPSKRASILRMRSATSFRFKTLGTIICLRENASSCRVRFSAACAADAASSSNSHKPGACASSARTMAMLPMIAVSMLLKSCATPPANCPTDSIF